MRTGLRSLVWGLSPDLGQGWKILIDMKTEDNSGVLILRQPSSCAAKGGR